MVAASPRFRRWLFVIVAFALVVRVAGIDWDQGHMFHPDERRIAFALGELSLRPLQWNPHFFAYGSLPFYLIKLVSAPLAHASPWFASYLGGIYVGRALSCVWGAATVLLLALLGRRLYGERAGLLAGGLLAATVLHVQNSRFATNDVPLTCLVVLALVAMAKIGESGRGRDWALAGVAFGLALATKFSALPLLLPLAVAAWLRVRAGERFPRVLRGAAIALGAAAIAFSVGEPYALLHAHAYFHDIVEQSEIVRHAGLVPYTTQYIGVPKVIYDLREMVLWGMGPLLGLAAVGGTLALFVHPRRLRQAEWVLLAWVVPFAVVTFSFEVKFLRYLLPIYPFLILWGAAALGRWASARWGRIARVAVIATTALYLLAFLAIGTRAHTEVTASRWFYTHVPAGSRVLGEHWDEGFPLPLPGYSPDRYEITNFPYYDPDTPAKMASLAGDLASSEAVVLQTKRIYGAVTRAPSQYPLTVNYFRELFAGDLGYALVRENASRPRLLGIELPDELADESFSVYDHPKVLIFRNIGHLTGGEIEAKIMHGTPSHPLTRDELLLAHPSAVAPPPRPALIGSSLAAIALTAALLELLGLVALALLRTALPDRRGLAALAKVVGVLLFAYFAWLLVSLGVLPFRQPALLAIVALLAAGGWAVWWRWPPGPSQRHEVVVTEAVFWGVFALFLLLRLANPEITWGEKPMDFSFLNTLYRTATLPPPEPWFAGSPLSYTYFGHFTVAALGKALGIAPALMFNLGIPTFAAMTAVAALAAGALLGRSLRAGAAASGLIVLVGNLAGVRELIARHAISFDYFWATSRVIPDTINEFPFWSFVFADLHAHVMAMPWALAFVAVVLLWLDRRRAPLPTRPAVASAAIALLGVLLLGAIGATNGWSMPVYSALLAVALVAHWLATRERSGLGGFVSGGLRRVVVPAGVAIAGAVAAFAPLWLQFTPPVRQWGWERGPFARPSDVLTVFGGLLVMLVPLLFLAWRTALAGGARPTLGQRLAIAAVAAMLGLSLLDLRALGALALRQAPSIRTFALALVAFGACLAVYRRTPERWRLPALLTAFAFALVGTCEIVYVWDRMNTVFKFYLDAWLLLGVAAGVALVELSRRRHRPGIGVVAWRVAATLAIAVGVFTSATGAVGALRPRRAGGPTWTLDGMAYLARKAPEEEAAIHWLNREIRGAPVLCEAYGPSYQDYSRVSMNTGLPIVLGWDYHVFQRGHSWREIDARKADVRTIYTSPDESQVAAVLRRDRVSLLYVGPLERSTYDGANLANFERWRDLLTPVYRNAEVVIFRVTAAGAPRAASPKVPGLRPRRSPNV
jgi:YYY domain-containing protein